MKIPTSDTKKIISDIEKEISKIKKEIDDYDITGQSLAFLCFEIDGLYKALNIIQKHLKTNL